MEAESQFCIIQRDTLPEEGVGGVRERRLVQSWGGEGSRGFSSFVYLADTRMCASAKTGTHHHRDLDLVTFLMNGRIEHRGSLKDAAILEPGAVLVQRAGRGIEQNDVNPHGTDARVLNLWFAPPRFALDPGFHLYRLHRGEWCTVLGGGDPAEVFDNRVCVRIGWMTQGQRLSHAGRFMAYMARGEAMANQQRVREGDLIEAAGVEFFVDRELLLLMVYKP